ncbi:hypothetical protein ACH4S9_12900 [Streptomyces sp. NPDC021225]|uniref:hypothetical protein n=1 Tax=Streptomyces sp. NPDC021225 TaxID=3365121 RepID=UPI0037AD95F6
MSPSAVITPRNPRPPWLPDHGVIDAVPAGRWWDAVAIDGPLGHAVADRLRDAGCPGPVLCDPLGPKPRVHFLVPAHTARCWTEPDTSALGESCYVTVTGTLDADNAGVHWITPPSRTRPLPLVPPAALRRALSEARVAP